MYLERAIDRFGQTLDFTPSERRDKAAATAFLKRAIENNGVLDKVVINKSRANYAGLENINLLFMLLGFWRIIAIIQAKYLNNSIERTIVSSRRSRGQ